METILLTLAASTATEAAVVFTLGDAFLVATTAAAAGAAIGQGQAIADRSEADAILAGREATREREIGEREAGDLGRRRSAAFATNRALRGGFGTVDATGTNLLKNEQFIEQSALDVEMVRVGGVTRASTLEAEAAISRAKGKAAKAQGVSKAGSSLLSGTREVFG